MSRKQRKPRRPALNLERLEDRIYFAVDLSLADRGHTLLIQGDRGDNQIEIVQDQSGVHVTADGRQTRSFTGIDAIVVDAGGGADDVRVIYAFNPQPDPPGLPVSPASLNVSLGSGNDKFSADITYPPDPCRIVVDAGSGDDIVTLRTLVDPRAGGVDFTANLGAGNDIFDANLADSPNLDRPVTIDPPQPDRILVDAGAGDDVVTLRALIDPNLRSVDFTANLGAGNDRFDGNVAFNAPPSDSPPSEHASPSSLTVQGGAGDDTISSTFGSLLPAILPAQVPGAIAVLLEGGAGDDIVQNTM